MPKITLTHVTKNWDKFYAVDDLNLVIEDNAFVTLLGPSGCGKTTTLRMIAGLETPTSGRITIGDQVVFDSDAGINIPANKRKVGFLFQNYALWPNMTVYQNISFGLSNIKESLPKADFTARKNAALIKALESPDDIIKTIQECVDKKGKLDVNKAHIKLIDRYEISIFAAKTLMSYKLHESVEPAAVAKAKIAELEKALAEAENKCKSAGCTFDSDYTYLKNGQPLMEVRKLSKEEIDLAVRRVARIVKIGMFMDRYPAELSGGQQQRVAIARTLAPEPSVLFMDEPLSNLDAKLRLEMRSELQRLHLETGSTFVYVTHDQMEAMTLATKICLIENGVLQQTQKADGSIGLSLLNGVQAAFTPDGPLSLTQWYADAEAAEAARKAAEAEKSAKKGHIEKGNKDSLFRYHVAMVDETEDFGDEVEVGEEDFVIGVRPEFLSLEEDGPIAGEVYSAMPTGMETTVKIRVGEFLLTGVVFGGVLYRIGQKVTVDFRGNDVILFSRKNGKRIAQGRLTVQ